MALNSNFPTFEANPFLKGLQFGQQNMANNLMFPRELLQKELANRILGIQAQYAEPLVQENLRNKQISNKYLAPTLQSQLENRRAQTGLVGQESNKIRQLLPQELLKEKLQNQIQSQLTNPSYRSPQTGFLESAQQSGKFSPEQMNRMIEAVAGSQEANNIYKSSLSSTMNQNAKYKLWSSLPAAEKNLLTTQAKALDIPLEQFVELYRHGNTIGQIAKMKGYKEDLSNVPELNFAPGQGEVNKLRASKVALAGVKSLDNFINDGLGGYSGSPLVHGTPIPLLMDKVRGENKDKQAKFFAATVLAQDQQFARAKSTGAPLGISLLRHSLNSALANKTAGSFGISEDVFKKGNEYITQELDKMNQAQQKALYKSENKGQEKNKYSKSSDKELLEAWRKINE